MRKILIVEDDEAIADLISMNLKGEGHLCTLAHGGMEGADLIEKRRFDLVLLDIMLPEVDGFELMEYIRPLEIPVIFLTGTVDRERIQKLIPLKPAGYLLKTAQPQELKGNIDSFFQSIG